MKKNQPTPTQIATVLFAIIFFCVISFCLGRLSVSRNTITYSVDGYRTTVNLAWSTYGLPMTEYTTILNMLQQNLPKEKVIPSVEVWLDFVVYDAEFRRPFLHGRDLESLDKVLTKVARYRQQYPRPVLNSTNSLDQVWIAKQKSVDAFLRRFAK